MSSFVVAQPPARARFFEDVDGATGIVKTEDEVFPLTNTWPADIFADGETISASTWTDDGVTTSAAAISGQKTTCKVSGTGGETVNKITTSLGYVHQRVFRFHEPAYAP